MNRVANLRTSCIAISLVYAVEVAPTLTAKTVKSPRNVIDFGSKPATGRRHLLMAMAVMQIWKMRVLVP